MRQRHGQDVLPALDLGDHLQVRLQLNERRKRAADHRDLFGEQYRQQVTLPG
jgi:hypothetical protein